MEKYSSPFFSHEFLWEKWFFIADGQDCYVYKNQDRNWNWKWDKILKISINSNLSIQELEKYYLACEKFDDFLQKKFENSWLKIRSLYTKIIGENNFDFWNYSYSILPLINGKNFLDEDINNILIEKYWVSKNKILKLILSSMREFFWLERISINDMNIMISWDEIVLTDIWDIIKSLVYRLESNKFFT